MKRMLADALSLPPGRGSKACLNVRYIWKGIFTPTLTWTDWNMKYLSVILKNICHQSWHFEWDVLKVTIKWVKLIWIGFNWSSMNPMMKWIRVSMFSRPTPLKEVVSEQSEPLCLNKSQDVEKTSSSNSSLAPPSSLMLSLREACSHQLETCSAS